MLIRRKNGMAGGRVFPLRETFGKTGPINASPALLMVF